MGGRMSGDSPREKKVEFLAGSTADERAYQVNVVGETVTPTLARQRSRQQLIACWPCGQHASFASEFELWQAVDIEGEVAANAAIEPCKPMASINMTATS
jgi:hypothetical protein